VTKKRITVVLDLDVDKILRVLQAKNIREKQSSHSFSKTMNDVLRKGLGIKFK